MAKSNPSIKIELTLQNVEKIKEQCKQLTEGTDDFSLAAQDGLKTIQNLLKATEHGSKITRSALGDISEEFNKAHSRMNRALVEEGKNYATNLELVEKLKTELKGLKELEVTQAGALSVAKKNHSEEEIMKIIKGQSLEELGITKEEIAKYGEESLKSKMNIFYGKSNLTKTVAWQADVNNPDEKGTKKFLAIKMLRKYKELEEQTALVEKDLAEKHEATKKAINEKTIAMEKANQQVKNSTYDTHKKIFSNIIDPSQELSKELSDAKEKMDIGGFTTGELEGKDAHVNKLTKSIFRQAIILRAFKSAVQASVRAIKELDDAITNMTVITGQSRKVTYEYVNDFTKMAKATSSTITEMASLTAEYIRQGRSMKDAQIMAKETAKAAKIAGISVADSLTYMTSAINGFNLSAEEASHVSDVFAELAAVSATNYNQLAVALSKVSAQANQAGMSIEYTTSLLAKGIETTQEAPESIGTALKTVIARFRELSDFGSTLEDGATVNGVEDALSAVGVALRDTSGEFRSLQDVLNELGPKWDELTGMQRQAIAQAAAGTRQQSRFLAIMQDWNRTMDLVTTSEKAAGAAAAQYSKYADGMTAALTNLESAWQSVIIAMTDNEGIIAIVHGLTDLLDMLSEVINKTGKILPILVTAGIAITGISFAMNKYRIKAIELIKAQAQATASNAINEEKSRDALKLTGKIEITQAKQNIKAMKERAILKKKQDYEERKMLQGRTNEELLAINEVQRKELQHQKTLSELKIKTSKTEKTKAKYRGVVTDIDKKLSLLDADDQKIKNDVYDYHTDPDSDILKYDDAIKGLDKLEEKLDKLPSGIFLVQTFALDALRKVKKSLMGLGQDFLKIGQKGFRSTRLGSLASMGAIAGAIGGSIYAFSEARQQYDKIEEDSLAKISDNMSKTYDTKTKVRELKTLKKEYVELSSKIAKTTEEEKKLSEIKESLLKDYGISGDDVVKDIDEKTTSMDLAVSQKLEDSMTQAFKAAVIKGNKIFEKQEFKTVIKTKYESYGNTGTETTAKGRFQKKQYEDIINNIDLDKEIENITSARAEADAKRISQAENNGIIKGVITGGLKGLAVGVTTGNIGLGVATAIGAGLADTKSYAKREAAAEAAEIGEEISKQVSERALKITGEVNKFTAEFAEAHNKTLGEQFETYSKIIKNYEGTTLNAIKATYSYFSLLEKLKLTKEDLNKMQMIGDKNNVISDDVMKKFISKASELGEKSGAAFIDSWRSIIDKMGGKLNKSTLGILISGSVNGLNKDEIQALLQSSGLDASLVEAADFNLAETIKKESEENLKALKDAEVEAKNKLDTFKTMSFETFMSDENNKKKYAGMLYSDVASILNSEYNNAVENTQNAATSISEITDLALDLISPFQDLTQLSQKLTALESGVKNANSFAEKLEKGTLTAEEWAQAAVKYVDVLSSQEWLDAKDNGTRADLIRNHYGVSSRKERIESLNSYAQRIQQEQLLSIQELNKKIAEETDEKIIQSYKDQKTSLENSTKATLQAIESMKELTLELSKAEIDKIAFDRKEKDLNKLIDKGDISSYEDLIELYNREGKNKRNEANELLADKINAGKKENWDLFDWTNIFEDLYQGNSSSYTKWLEKATPDQKEFFKNTFDEWIELRKASEDYYDTATKTQEDYENKKEEIQNEALEKYKDYLEEQYDKTKESLEKRKEIYQEYFDSLEQEEEENDYEEKRNSLLNTISALSTSRDANSLSKLKDAEKELADLEKDQRKKEREDRKEATMKTLDEEMKQLDKIHEEAMKNNAYIWSNFQKLGMNTIKELYRHQDGYYEMKNDADRKKWDDEWDKKHSFIADNSAITVSKQNTKDLDKQIIESYGNENNKNNLNSLAAYGSEKKDTGTNINNNSVSNVEVGDISIKVENLPEGVDANEVAKIVYDIFREEMKKRGINMNYS